MVCWHHGCNEHELEQTLGDREGQGGLACGSPWGHKESDTTEQLSTAQHGSFCFIWASLVAQLVKNLPALWETRVQSLGREDPLEKERPPTPVFWPGEIHGLYSAWGHKESDTTE